MNNENRQRNETTSKHSMPDGRGSMHDIHIELDVRQALPIYHCWASGNNGLYVVHAHGLAMPSTDVHAHGLAMPSTLQVQ